nr:extracellular solute-binding protein [Marinicella sp. W31]MDC2878519.1 extracellular solute-binding protein [Marinicella sp. W31]
MQFKPTGTFTRLLGSAAIAALLPLAAQAQDTKTITSWDLRSDTATAGIVRAGMDRFEATHPGYVVEDLHFANDAYKTKLKIAFGANEPPCVFASWGGGPLKEYVDSGQVVDLTPYLEDHAAFKDRFVPASFGAVTFDDNIYGIPAENTTIAAIFYNTEIFDDLGLTPPETWDDLMHVITVLNENNIAPFALANKNKWPGSMYFVLLADRIGGPEVFQKAAYGEEGGSFEDPAFIEAGERLQELVKANAFARGYNGLDYDVGGSRRLLYANRAAMELMGSWEMATIRNENPEFAKKVDFFTFPSVPGGKGDPSNVAGTIGDNFLSISAECPYKDAAFDLLMSMTDDQSAKDRLADQRVMPLKGITTEDPFLNKVLDVVGEAGSVQLWYDQELPPAVGEVHKDTVQQLFGLSITPEEAAAEMEQAAQAEAKQ